MAVIALECNIEFWFETLLGFTSGVDISSSAGAVLVTWIFWELILHLRRIRTDTEASNITDMMTIITSFVVCEALLSVATMSLVDTPLCVASLSVKLPTDP